MTEPSPLLLAPMVALLRVELDAVAAHAEDPEHVHLVRVMLGRIRAWCRLSGDRRLRDRVRDLRRAAGPLRDLDVLGADPELPAVFTAWLKTRRADARDTLSRTVAHPSTEALLADLSAAPGLPRADAHRALRRLEARLLASGPAMTATPPDLDGVHDLRKRTRELRYALQWLDLDPGDVRRFQKTLGFLGDLRALEEHHAVWPEHDRAPELRTLMARRMSTGLATAQAAWPLLHHQLTTTGSAPPPATKG